MSTRNPFQNYNNQNTPPSQNQNHVRRPPPAKKQLNNNNSTNNNFTPNDNNSKGINTPFAQTQQSNQNKNSPFNNQNMNNNYNNNIHQPPPSSKNFTQTPNNNYQNNTPPQQQKQEEEDDDSNNENNNTEPKHKTSQSHKTPDQNYSINPSQIPRPNQTDEIFLNNEKMPIYETNISTAPPHPISFFATKETQNSSPRFIRSTLNSVPISQTLLNETNLLFGLCIQPFAEVPDYEEQIPKVPSGDSIFRCKQCKSYINNKYNICYSQQNKQVAVCNLCFFENDFDMNKPGIKK